MVTTEARPETGTRAFVETAVLTVGRIVAEGGFVTSTGLLLGPNSPRDMILKREPEGTKIHEIPSIKEGGPLSDEQVGALAQLTASLAVRHGEPEGTDFRPFVRDIAETISATNEALAVHA